MNTASEEKATQIKNNISHFLKNDVFPALENLFDNWDDDQIIRFDNINVDVNVKEWSNNDALKRDLVKKVMLKIDDGKVALINQKIKKKKLKDLPGDFKEPEKYLSSKTESFSKELDVESHQTLREHKTIEQQENYQSTMLHLSSKTESYSKEFDVESHQTLRGHKTIEQQENYQSTMLHFLAYGFLPWFGKQEYIKELTLPKQWLQNLKQHNFLIKLKALFRENKTAIERFVFQFPDEQVFAFIDLNETIQIRNKPELLRYLQNLTPELRGLFLNYLVGRTVNSKLAEKDFKEFIKIEIERKGEITNQLLNGWNEKFIAIMQLCFHEETVAKYFSLTEEKVEKLVKEISSVITGTQVRAEEEELKAAKFENKSTIDSQDFVKTLMEKEPPFFAKSMNEIVVRNAGMVLFHPFLNSFFKSFNWLNENGIIYPKKQIHAVQSLHFLATGNDDFFEGDLVLEKFLCGVPLNSPIPNKSLLTAKVKNEVSILLKEVVGHWPALKNTSPDGLRQMFVHRDGKLIQKEKGFRLIVERKAQDILLEKLQWNISIVKLPWKNDLLFVDW